MVVISRRLFRNGIELVLRAAGGHIVCGCETLDEAEETLRSRPELQPDLFVIGMDQGDRATRDLTRIRALRTNIPDARWIVLSSGGGPEFWWEAVESRVDGILHEDSPGEVLQLLVRLILLGYSFLPAPPDAASSASGAPDAEGGAVGRDIQSLFRLPDEAARPASVPAPQMRAGLSEREREILRGLVAGQSNKAIARDLHISEATVKVHVKALLRKMQVTNRTQAAISALRFLSKPEGES